MAAVIDLALEDRDGAAIGFQVSADYLAETTSLISNYEPGLQALQIVSGCVLTGSEDRILTLTGDLLSRFDLPYRGARIHDHPDDHSAVEARRFGIAALLAWIAGNEESAIAYSSKAVEEHSGVALLEGKRIAECVHGALSDTPRAFQTAMQTLLRGIEDCVATGEYGAEFTVYTPAGAMLHLVRRLGINLPTLESPVLPTWIQASD